MPITSHRLGLLSTLLLSACSSVPISPLPATDHVNRAEVLVFRDYAFNAGGVSLAVGMGTEAFAKLENSEYVIAQVAAGDADFYVQARTAEPTKLRVGLKAGEKVCLKTEADPGNLGKVLLPPLLMATGYRFTLEKVACPSEAELVKYKRVYAAYRPT